MEEENEVKEIGETQAPEEEKKFTQSQVNELMGRTRQEAHDRTIEEARAEAMRELLAKYGVENADELDSIFGRGQAYDVLNEDYATQNTQLKNSNAENALLKSKINESRWEDAKAILNSKGLEVTYENLQNEMLTHPEWSPVEEKKEEAPMVIRKMGVDLTDSKDKELSEEEQISKWFGLGR